VSLDFNEELRKITNQGSYNVAPKLPAPVATNNKAAPVAKLPSSSLATGASNLTSSQSSSDLTRLMNAIRGQESNNNYQARNKDSGALGAYQVMPFNLSGWGKEAVGHAVTPEEFMSNSSLQDQIAQYKLNQYLQQYGAAGAAAAWYGGPGSVAHMDDNKPQAGGYPSMRAYYEAILRRMG
jgi:hypothetical protein